MVEVVPVAPTRGHPRSPCDHYYQSGIQAKTPAAHGAQSGGAVETLKLLLAYQ